MDKDVRWVKVFCHDFQLKWAFPPQGWWPRWPSGSPFCCFCREINKWAFDRQLSNFLFIQLCLLLWKRLPGLNWNNADEGYLEERFPCAWQRYYGLHRCFLMFVLSGSTLGDCWNYRLIRWNRQPNGSLGSLQQNGPVQHLKFSGRGDGSRSFRWMEKCLCELVL